jgi:hypothetical protein
LAIFLQAVVYAVPLACIIREASEEWFWGGEIAAKMLAAA